MEQKSSTADFIRNLCSQASLTYISVELLANLLETALSNRSMSHDLLKKLLKVIYLLWDVFHLLFALDLRVAGFAVGSSKYRMFGDRK